MTSLQGNSELLMNIVLDSSPPRDAPLSAKYKRSFAYPSMKDRLPVIISKLADYLYREKQKIIATYGEGAQEELKTAIGEISQLKNQLQTAKPFEKFSSGDPDTELWNAHIDDLLDKGEKLNYYEADWLFAECYLYRKIREIFATKKCLSTMDPFSHQKSALLAESMAAICPLMNHMEEECLLDNTTPLSMKQKYSELSRFLKCSLWANRMDLSISAGSTSVKSDMLHEIKDWDCNILINDLPKVVSHILGANNCNQVVDIITDNSGLEILCDMCLADFLVSRCNVTQLTFRVKPIPWYVSDIIPTDLYQTIETVKSFPSPLYQKFGERWENFLKKGIWKVTSDIYWCLGLSYCEMADCDPLLYNELCKCSLIIFKGDLNYRKLLQDINWCPSTPFSEALGKFHPAPLVTLRTNKADLICGIDEELATAMEAKDNEWLISGKFGVVQFDSP